MRNKHLFNYRTIAAAVAFIGLFALLIVAGPAQASPALQLTPGPTVIVPTVVIPDTGGDTTTVVNTTPLFSNWIFWAALGLILLVVVIALLARPTTTHTHHDDHL